MPDKVLSLPFGHQVPTSSASTPADRVLRPCLDTEDPDADLDQMSNDELRRHVDELKAGRDRRHDVVIRMLKGIGILDGRGLIPGRSARCDLVEAPAARPERSRASARRRFLALVRRVHRSSSPGPAEALAEFLAIDFVHSEWIPKFRVIARAIREGMVDPPTVRAAYKAAKKPGVNRPSAMFVSCVVRHSPGLLECARRQRARPGRRAHRPSSSGHWFQ